MLDNAGHVRRMSGVKIQIKPEIMTKCRAVWRDGRVVMGP